MITVLVPTFDEFNKYKFIKYVEVSIKNKPDWQDVNKIKKHLPGIPTGYVSTLKDLLENGTKDVPSFYDGRQNTRKLKGHYVIVKK